MCQETLKIVVGRRHATARCYCFCASAARMAAAHSGMCWDGPLSGARCGCCALSQHVTPLHVNRKPPPTPGLTISVTFTCALRAAASSLIALAQRLLHHPPRCVTVMSIDAGESEGAACFAAIFFVGDAAFLVAVAAVATFFVSAFAAFFGGIRMRMRVGAVSCLLCGVKELLMPNGTGRGSIS